MKPGSGCFPLICDLLWLAGKVLGYAETPQTIGSWDEINTKQNPLVGLNPSLAIGNYLGVASLSYIITVSLPKVEFFALGASPNYDTPKTFMETVPAQVY